MSSSGQDALEWELHGTKLDQPVGASSHPSCGCSADHGYTGAGLSHDNGVQITDSDFDFPFDFEELTHGWEGIALPPDAVRSRHDVSELPQDNAHLWQTHSRFAVLNDQPVKQGYCPACACNNNPAPTYDSFQSYVSANANVTHGWDTMPPVISTPLAPARRSGHGTLALEFGCSIMNRQPSDTAHPTIARDINQQSSWMNDLPEVHYCMPDTQQELNVDIERPTSPGALNARGHPPNGSATRCASVSMPRDVAFVTDSPGEDVASGGALARVALGSPEISHDSRISLSASTPDDDLDCGRVRKKRKEGGFLCSHCVRSFDRQCDLNKHVENRHRMGTQTCQECLKTFRWPKDLRRHMLSRHPGIDISSIALANKRRTGCRAMPLTRSRSAARPAGLEVSTPD